MFLDISLLSANLIVVVLESCLYGVYTVLASCTLYLMLKRHDERRNSRHSTGSGNHRSNVGISAMRVGYVALFLAITTHWLLNIIRLFLAFHQDDPLSAVRFYDDLSHSTEIIKYSVLVVAMFISRSLGIYNVWVIWGFRTRVIIVPIIMLIGLTTFGVGLTYQLSVYTPGDSIFKAEYHRWTTGICFFGLCTAFYTTGFIWYKLWNKSQELKSFGMISVSAQIIKIFIHSAGLLTTWGIFHIITYQYGSNIQYVALDCTPVVIGISNLLIQIRMHCDLTPLT
ncbi:hypothetical protein FB45DRAFT_1010051 [Roridomyces roridus]|uniref:Uncharacterized protein n=1 Tax=Roridomyces roridus TaxID=1738132 RepID=A0AAD7FBB0_9AGAR|nr:hypothetical protein FB45DRAFT_1010051 [Roridomyces roridus]